MRNGQGHGLRRRRRRQACCRGAGMFPLSECREEEVYVIIDNQDKQSMEMGLFSGARVKVIRNSIESPNMVIAINESRYMLNKETARQIMVK
jgi:Fe2+ transport system protein FeoA